ncbi:MAG: deoxyribodipyrimidine photo-lyase [Kosmotogaceae bacterium]|nr:deoxyribodipyrimidine photo-lyase [Kosmotogaceae bacterium]
MIEDRVHKLNKSSYRHGSLVLYWMQASQRTEENHAFELAKQEARELGIPCVVLFVLNGNYPSGNLRSFSFMLDGLRDMKSELEEQGMRFIVFKGDPVEIVPKVSKRCALVVTDAGYLRHQIDWRKRIAEELECPFLSVESNVVVPVKIASCKEEYSAATFRKKVMKHFADFVNDFEPMELRSRASPDEFEGATEIEEADLSDLDRSVSIISGFRGGQKEAKRKLEIFLSKNLDRFEEERNDPNSGCLSEMSPFLHFGHISPSYIASRVIDSGSKGKDAYIEELVVRRELSMNFVYYNTKYDSFEALPKWAQKTLNEHRNDKRAPSYSLSELESGETDDPYWNAAQKEMTLTGKMHGYMRMYWGKKLLEWSRDPESAIGTAIYLNDKYELDGRDPNGYAGILWCFGKHDRAWSERKIFGKVRYMNSHGLKRKFDIDSYVRRINNLSFDRK